MRLPDVPLPQLTSTVPITNASPAAACPLLRTKLIRMHSKRAKDTGVALALYDEMRQDGIAPDAVCFNTCLTAAGERRRVWRWQRGRADGAQRLMACMTP